MAKTQKSEALFGGVDPLNTSGVYGDPTASELTWEVRTRAFTPKEPRDAIAQARNFAGSNFFMSSLVQSKADFCNYGMRLSVEHSRKKAPREWVKEQTPAIRAFLDAAWREWISVDNLVLIWREKPLAPKRPISVIHPEDAIYSDAMGIETLTWPNTLTPQQKDSIPEPLKQRYSGATVVYGDAKWAEFNRKYPDFAEFFAVKTRNLPGYGYGFPRMRAVFPALAQCESMEVGEEAYAFLGRRVVGVHKIGHEIKNGPKAGMPTHFWKKKRADDIANFYRAKTGFIETTTNFDHNFEIWWIDPDKFAAKTWDTITSRIATWSGALGLIYAAKGVNTDMLAVFKTECLNARLAFGEFVTPIVEHAFQCPGDLTISWRNNCFENSRLAAEMLKWAQASAVASVQTAREEYLGTGEVERQGEQLAEEKKAPDKNTPGYSPSHGKKPDLSTPGGRPSASQ